MEWHLSGTLKHDNMVREEFSYDYSPNVSTCVAICDLHSSNENLNRFLVYHCQRLEVLLRPIQPGKPNPEIDYLLVAQMLYCLALSARKFESVTYNSIMEHAEILLMIVKNGCENLLPFGPLNSGSLRKLTDTLVRIEKFELAVDFSLKCGFSKTGVLAAWGISCLKAGMFETAREKFAYCLTRVKEDEYKENKDLIATINWQWDSKVTELTTRQNKSPPLIVEIKSILENLAIAYKGDVYQEKMKIPNMMDLRSICKQKDVILCEPAVNIKSALSNLRNIADGCLDDARSQAQVSPKQKKKSNEEDTQQMLSKNRYYQELMFYLLSYGGHIEIIQFLLDHGFLKEALEYLLIHKVEKDIFIRIVYTYCLKQGKSGMIIENMKKIDGSLKIWENYIKDICNFLEQKGFLNSLYHLQIILNDHIRAAMTCVRFYSQKSATFSELHSNSFHLVNAQKHLQSQLEIKDLLSSIKERRRRSVSVSSQENSSPLILKLDVKTM
jgi:zinc finger FYVE domain-containing protein 26